MDTDKPLQSTQTYRITRGIARGGMGAVYEAQQEGTAGFEKTVAIKTIRARFAADREFVRLFIGEAKLVADLVHQNIVQVYNLFYSEGSYFIVMEYVDGIDLEHFFDFHRELKMPLPIELCVFIVSRVCRGLEYAHEKRGPQDQSLGIVHRDISPRNIMLNYEGEVRITDFGIAKARAVMEQNEEVLMGRLEYMSPEQSQRQGTDRRSDLYSLGVVMYELLTGRRPGQGGFLAQPQGIAPGRVRPAQELRPELSQDLCAIVDRAIQADPRARYQTAGGLLYALEYYLYSEGYGATNKTLGEYLKEHFPKVRPIPEADQSRPTMVVD